MKYQCSLCGGFVQLTMLAVYPPIPRYECQSCGAVKQDDPIPEHPPIIIDMNPGDDPCLWDGMAETSPGSGVKIGFLSCPCKRCSMRC